MPLIDIKSSLTALKFGNDRPGYGSSNLPYIQTQIPDKPESPGIFKTIFRPTSTGNLDYPIRGGDIDFQVGQQTFTLSSKIDTVRIQKFLKDQPRGTNFITKQVSLQLTNPKIETGNVLFGLGQSAPIPGLLENTRVYNQGKNTIAQIRASGTGAHALRHGLVPFANYQKHYYLTVNEQNVNNEKSTNRLVNLNALKMTTGVSPFVNRDNVLDINLVNTLGISLNRNLLFQYLGGPGSTYGLGSTSIKRVVDTTRLRSSRVMTYDKLKSQTVNNITNGRATTNIQDFREQLPAIKGTYKSWTTGSIIQNRFYVSPGSYKDKLNLLKPFLFENSVAPWQINKTESDDLIKFVFEAISNDDPNYSIAVFFRAFLTAGITDNNSAQLNPTKYAGRGETFYTYQGFDRSISFSFRIAAGSKDELKPIYNRLNTLVSQVYPDYNSQSGFMRAPIVRVTIGDYLYRMPGFLENVNITVDNGSPWEINLDGDSAQLPQVIDVSVSFRPIFDELPRRTTTNIEVNNVGFSQIADNVNLEGKISATVPKLIANTPKDNNPVIDESIESIVYSSTRRATNEDKNLALFYLEEQARIAEENRDY